MTHLSAITRTAACTTVAGFQLAVSRFVTLEYDEIINIHLFAFCGDTRGGYCLRFQ